jgi:hypothetical protein
VTARTESPVEVAAARTQLRALLALRWAMMRAPGAKLAVFLAVLTLLWLLSVVATSAASLESAALDTAVQLAPTAFLGFAVLAVVAPLTAGGGTEVVPPDQLVAYPVRPRTHFLGGLALAPVNLVWVVQLLVLVAETGYLTRGGRPLLGSVTTMAFVVCLTVIGQAMAWTVAGLRQTQPGRRLVTSLGAAALITGVVVVRAGKGDAVLDASPTRSVVAGVVASGDDLQRWALTTVVLLLLAAVALVAGSRICGWALRRPGDAGSARAGSGVRRRRPARSALRELIALDRASVWRAPALRRGGVVLAVLPGLIAAGAGLPWQSLVVLPGLVAAGAALLFGVNAFCLDASGSVWLASLPHNPMLGAWSKLIVLTETVLAAVVVAAVSGSLRSPGPPTAAEISGIICSGLVCSAVVVATGMSMSVRHPHRADLHGPRDAVAPPGAMVVASVRLALPTAIVGMLIGGATGSGQVWLPPLLGLPMLLACILSVRMSLERYEDPFVRARIVTTVSAG